MKKIFQNLQKLVFFKSVKIFFAGALSGILLFLILNSAFFLSLPFLKNFGEVEKPKNSFNLEKTEIALTGYDFEYGLAIYRDLPIYPEIWVKKYFSDEEISKPHVSGPQVDADGDGLLNREEYLFNTNPKKKDTFCSLQKTTESSNSSVQETCKATPDGDRLNQGFFPYNNQTVETPLEFIIDKKFSQNIGNLQSIVGFSEGKNISFPVLFANSLNLSSQPNYLETKNDLVVFDQPYENIFSQEHSLLRYRQFQFYAEIMQSWKNNNLPETAQKYQKRLGQLTLSQAKPDHQKAYLTNIFVYQKAIEIIQQIQQFQQNESNLPIENLQNNFVLLFKATHSFDDEYDLLKSQNQI